ncbi:MAG: EAL domain-containing protein [Bacilli bacterium]|nr:EAL domain-containing protein [Bacilli bacterium]
MQIYAAFHRFTENLHCNYYLELCALVFLVAITIAYFTRKKFPVATARLFGVGLIFLTANVALDILFCVLLDHSDVVPLPFVEAAAELFFAMQFLISYSLFAYVFYAIGKSLRYSPIYLLTIIPSALGVILFFTNCLHHWNFTFVPGANGLYDFIPGPAFFSLYILNWGLNYLATIIYTVAFRKVLPKELLRVLIIIMIVVLSAAVVQTLQPQILLSGTAFALCAMFAVVSVCDPDVKVDRISKAFNDYAFVDYVNTQRYEKQRKYYIIFDIESFGMFSEKFGVVSANELIRSISKFIRSVNKTTYVFKVQSSRFVLLLKNREEQLSMLEAINERFDKPFTIKGHVVDITLHILYFKNNEVFTNSDMYNDFMTRTLSIVNFKDSSCIELDDNFLKQISRDRRIKEILEECLRTKQGLYMVYQPIYDVNKKVFNHFESLIRLANEELGYVGPAEFIPIAENFGLANDIDFFVLHQTCAFLARNPQIESLEVNISCAEFFNNPSERFMKIINSYGIDPSRIILEITETIAVKYPSKTKEFMSDLGQYGVKFAMDDFGSGYSNIARFITLPFSVAKLDKSLLGQAENITIFFDAAINLFKNLNIPIVIEGVEREDQLKLSVKKQIEYIQGYYFSKPLKEDDLLEFLAKNN